MSKGDTLSFEFPEEQLEHAHNLLPGKMSHVEDIGRQEGAFAAAQQTDEYKRRAQVYREFIKGSKPQK